MRRILLIWALLPALLWPAEETASEIALKLRHAGLDGNECYRVREINFSKEDARIYLTAGYLVFGQPVNGKRYSAVFTTDVEGGDGEILLMPPLRSERLSLATFTDSPNLNEHFRSALMLFTDSTAEELMTLVKAQERVRPSPEMGIVLEQKWSGTVNNLASSFGNRMVHDVLSEAASVEGFFYSAFTGTKHGNFDFVYDPVSQEQIQVGQVKFRDNRAYFDTWSSFEARSYRTGKRSRPGPGTMLRDYRIEATLQPDLLLKATTKATLTVQSKSHSVLYFDITRRMEVLEVLLDGEPCEIWQRESLRADLLRRNGNAVFLVIPPRPVEEGRAYEMEFRHEGRVVSDAGNGVYYVGSRGTWYPRRGMQFATYDVTFRFPEGLDLVFAGEVLEDRTDGDWHITRRKTESPVRLA
ncbi:MAG: M1 family metallopeptidase, partial [bacterium]|nr:M1 family metallopeptidase [bacterium]